MKKTLFVLPLVAGLLAAPAFSKSSKEVAKVSAEGELETYIEMNTSFFTNWDNSFGRFLGKDATYWGEGHSYNALDTFFDGCSEGGTEGKIGTLVSRTWTQKEQYVYFTWGGANNSHVGDDQEVKLVFHYGDQSEEMFNDTFSGLCMTLRYFKVPDAFFEAKNGASFTMYVELVDERGGDYGCHELGYFHPNQTLIQVGDACRYYVNNLRNTQTDLGTIRGHYSSGNASLKAAWHAVASDFSCDFEENSDFQHDFTYDWGYGNGDWMDGRHPLVAISSSEYRPANNSSNMPFNKSNNGFFKGWYQDDTGYVASDVPTYRFVSKPFVLSQNGLVSVKMGGFGASLHLIDCTDPANMVDLAWVDCRAAEDHGEDGLIATHNCKSTVTMIRHVINFEEYAGRTVRVAIADVSADGWGVAYFDELRTNVNLATTGFQLDRVVQTSGDGTSYFVEKDIYVNSTHIDNDPNGIKYVQGKDIITRVDSSDFKAAYEVVSSYFANFRTSGRNYNICNAEAAGSLVSAYNSLSAAGQAIVAASADYTQAGDGDWYRHDVVTSTVEYGKLTVGSGIQWLATKYNQAVNNKIGVFSSLGLDSATSYTITIVVLVSVLSAAAFALLTIRRRKHLNK